MATMTDQDDDQSDPSEADETPDKPDNGKGTKDLARRYPPKFPEAKRTGPAMPTAAAIPSGDSGPGFFHIYKKGQGKWTRVGTVIGAALLGGMSCYFMYNETSYRQVGNFTLGYLPAGIFAVLYIILSFYLMNKPRNVDFLIATDSEMKKVNWTSRKELWGSTKVVILFMFVIAIFLFVMDHIFGYFFYWIRVLKVPPF